MSADSPDPNDLPPATREALDSLGGALGDLAELDEEQLAETTALLKTLGHDEAADLLANRRDVLKTVGAVGAGGLLGAAGVSSATGRAEAGTNQAGTIGTPSNPVDVEAEDVNAAMVDADAVHTDKESITGSVLRVSGVDGSGSVVFYSDFDIESYASIGHAVQDAHDQLIAAGSDGGTIEYPTGTYQTGKTVVQEIHLTHKGQGVPDPWTTTNYGEVTVVEYTGTGNAYEVRGTSSSPQADRINAGSFENLAVVPNTAGSGSAGVFLDGTTATNSNGSVVRNITFRDFFVGFFGSYGLHGKGNVFDIYHDNLSARGNRTADVKYEQGTNATNSQQPSQLDFVAPQVQATEASEFGMDVQASELKVFGGNIEGYGTSGLRFNGGWGELRGVHFEGDGSTGTTGVVYSGTGPFYLTGGSCSSWGTGVSVGDPNDTEAVANGAYIDPHFSNNGSEDVSIISGDQRRRARVVDPSATVTNDRLATDNQQDTVPVISRYSRIEKTFAVDSTGMKSDSIFPQHPGSVDQAVASVAGTSDGSGGTVTDFAMTQPVVDKTDRNHTVFFEVTDASATSGAEVTIEVIYLTLSTPGR